MYSIPQTVFKATIGLLVNKGLKMEAAMPREGDVTDHKFRSFVINKIEQVECEFGEKEDLRRSISHFNEGVVQFFKAFDESQTKTREKHTFQVPYEESTIRTTPISEISISDDEDSIRPISERLVSSDEIPWPTVQRNLRPTLNEPGASIDEAFELLSIESSPSSETTLTTKEAFQVPYGPYVGDSPPVPRKRIWSKELVELAKLDDSERALSRARREFKEAYLQATEAFNNEDLKPSGSVQAMAIRVAATILTKVEYPEDALAPCMLYLEELHSTAAVQFSFAVELLTGLKKAFFHRLPKDFEHRTMISGVCHVNRVIYDLMQIVGKVNHLMTWPCVNTSSLKNLSKRSIDAFEEKVDPLRDSRVTNVLCELGMEHYCVTPWSFGQNGEEEHKLKDPRGVATSSEGCFFIADQGDRKVKVFDRRGKFNFSLNLPPVNDVRDVAIDRNDCLYVLVGLQNSSGNKATGVCVFEKSGRERRFLLRKSFIGWNLTVSDNNKVLVTSSNQTIDVYEPNGKPISSFGEGTLKTDAFGITSANDDRVMVLNKLHSDVQVFTEQGHHVFNFHVDGSYHTHDRYPKIAFHKASEHLVVAGIEKKTLRLDMLIYTKKGEFVRRIQYGKERIDCITGGTVTAEGRFAAVVRKIDSEGQVHSKILVV